MSIFEITYSGPQNSTPVPQCPNGEQQSPRAQGQVLFGAGPGAVQNPTPVPQCPSGEQQRPAGQGQVCRWFGFEDGGGGGEGAIESPQYSIPVPQKP